MTENTTQPTPELSFREYLWCLPGAMIPAYFLGIATWASLRMLSYLIQRRGITSPLIESLSSFIPTVAGLLVFAIATILFSLLAYDHEIGLRGVDDARE